MILRLRVCAGLMTEGANLFADGCGKSGILKSERSGSGDCLRLLVAAAGGFENPKRGSFV